ncbi:hypothetical protein [Limnobacter alexandrii]|uniref:hypothetical protein n=1 Tax=Limnobacter alexandrii TaxID=2570352 RepID=UPI001107C0A6|nr:hypothetical protein [Limnobacter alexandrii]
MKLVALKGFSWAHAGVRIEEFSKDQVIETEDEDLIKVATQEKWAKQAGKSESKGKEEKPETPPVNPDPEL